MKKVPLLFLVFFIFSNCVNAQKRKSKIKSNEDSVLGLNAIVADQNYYSKAVLEYKLVNEILDGYSSTTQLIPSDNPKLFLSPEYQDNNKRNQFLVKHGKPTVTVFPDLQNQSQADQINKSDRSRSIRDQLKELGVESCQFQLPKNTTDLNSGFQFNHYYFKGSNKAAMQAFGIVDSEFNMESIYIVTDYIQYKDCKCTGIPTIRYAIGLRSEFKISAISAKVDIKGVSSLAGLAAQAETKNMKVDITVKTIGITGVDSKLNIPNNTSFDVSTYKDYQDVISFIKTFEETDDDKLEIHPEIIPVMDEYRTTLAHSFEPMYEKIEQLEDKLNILGKEIGKRKTFKNEKINKAFSDLDSLKILSITDEIKRLTNERGLLETVDTRMNSYKRYSKILEVIQGY